MMWSGNIAYPMIAHFVNNAVQVILQYFVRNDTTRMHDVDNYSNMACIYQHSTFDVISHCVSILFCQK
jgi:membrane protease YdiL (CAAX protease family)